jgi:hypothetical protein
VNTDQVLTWNEVVERHGCSSGIRYKNDRVVSILCGGEDHTDQIDGNEVIYRVPKKVFYRRARDAMLSALGGAQSFVVFRKIGKNRWSELGRFIVRDATESPQATSFHLIPYDRVT